jgi:hypothetical protein
MAGAFRLDDYKSSVPKKLWRVIHFESQCRQDEVTNDIVAADTTRAIYTKWSLKQAAEEHFDWFSRRPSCFLSTFSCQKHARRWAEQRQLKHDHHSIMDEVYLQEIDTTKLPVDTYVFDATSLAVRLRIDHPYSDDEFIFLYRIPSASLGRTWSLGELEERGTYLLSLIMG